MGGGIPLRLPLPLSPRDRRWEGGFPSGPAPPRRSTGPSRRNTERIASESAQSCGPVAAPGESSKNFRASIEHWRPPAAPLGLA
ncbi:hypothetical protein FKM82_024041 [Ascaphus truei]